jgi:transposase-like protein
LEGNLIEGLTVFKLPEHFRRRLRTSNMCERINREIKHDTKSPLPATADEVKRFTDAVAKCPGVSLIKAESIPDSRFPIEYLD